MAPDGRFNPPHAIDTHSLAGEMGEREASQVSWPQPEGRQGILTSLAALGSDTQAKVMSQVETTSAGVLPRRAPSWMNKSHCKSHRS